jgi:hypothetical protein
MEPLWRLRRRRSCNNATGVKIEVTETAADGMVKVSAGE